jgi:predicted TIM-barrel enzyme
MKSPQADISCTTLPARSVAETAPVGAAVVTAELVAGAVVAVWAAASFIRLNMVDITGLQDDGT